MTAGPADRRGGGRRIAALVTLAGIGLVGGAVAFYQHELRETWYLSKLGTKDDKQWQESVKQLVALRSRRALPHLFSVICSQEPPSLDELLTMRPDTGPGSRPIRPLDFRGFPVRFRASHESILALGSTVVPFLQARLVLGPGNDRVWAALLLYRIQRPRGELGLDLIQLGERGELKLLRQASIAAAFFGYDDERVVARIIDNVLSDGGAERREVWFEALDSAQTHSILEAESGATPIRGPAAGMREVAEKLLGDADPAMRLLGAQHLHRLPDWSEAMRHKIVAALFAALGSTDAMVRWKSTRAFNWEQLQPCFGELAPKLIAFLGDPDEEVQCAVWDALEWRGRVRPTGVSAAIERGGPRLALRVCSYIAAEGSRDCDDLGSLRKLFSHPDPDVGRTAAEAFGSVGVECEAGVSDLLEILRGTDERAIQSACLAIPVFSEEAKKALPWLRGQLASAVGERADALAGAIRTIEEP